MSDSTRQAGSPGASDALLIGQSPAMRELRAAIRSVAPTEATVLVQGETGSGKELVSRAVHQLSRRRRGPLITVDCPAVPIELFEAELFGHAAGAFTGSIGTRPGHIELADGGTLFLDEVGELPLAAQGKLLRTLQERAFQRIGGGAPRPVDLRIVTATNRELALAVRRGEFRADLYYRLSVFPLRVPPLRERLEDLPALVEHFLRLLGRELRRALPRPDEQSWRRLHAYDWPGNVRELRNILERAAVVADGVALEIPPLPDAHVDLVHEAAGCEQLAAITRAHIVRILDDTDWVIEGPRGAAARLGMAPSTLRYRMTKLGIHR